MGPTDSSVTQCIFRTYLQISVITYRNGISSPSSSCWLVGRLWFIAFKPRNEYSLNMPNGQHTSFWSATVFSQVFGESAACKSEHAWARPKRDAACTAT